VEALDWGDNQAEQQDLIAHWLHTQDADPVLDQHRKDLLFETAKVRISPRYDAAE
jgi:hypothetical protein